MTRLPRARRWAWGLAPFALAAGLVSCTEVESASVAGYEPAVVEHNAAGDVERVRFTAEGAERTGLETAPVRRRGKRTVVPYAALIYDGAGASHVYVVKGRLTFERIPVTVARIERDEALLKSGPPAGSTVVTVGAAEVYGTELGIEGGH